MRSVSTPPLIEPDVRISRIRLSAGIMPSPSEGSLTGFSSDYRIDLARDDGVLRVERAADPVPVPDGERAGVVEHMRGMVPDWTWNGPPIPEHKPFFHELLAGRDGRIWVRLATAAHPVENEDHDLVNGRIGR